MVSLDKKSARELGHEIVMFAPDVVRMLRGVVADDRVPPRAKAEAGAALAWLLSPRNRLTNLIPVVGQLDDIAIVAFALRRLLVGAGEPLLREHWRGSERGFQLLMQGTAALATPRGMFRGVAMVRSAAGAIRGGRSSRSADGTRVVDGQVIARGPDSRS